MARTHQTVKPIILILALGLILRFGFLAIAHPWSYPIEQQLTFNDSPLYHGLACTLLDYHRFAASGTAGPDLLRTPLYPLFVAGIYALFGKVPWVVFVMQILLDCFSCYLVFLALRRTLNERVAHIGAFFYAIDPFLILYTSSFLTETLFVFSLAVVLYIYAAITVQGDRGNAALQYGLLGLTLGLATLVRPVALHTAVILVGFLLVAYRKRLVVFLKYSAALLIAFAVALSPWLIRNYRTFGSPALTYCDSWILLAGYVGSMEASKHGQDLDSASEKLAAEADTLMVRDGLQPEDLNLVEKAKYWRRLAYRYIQRDPIHFAIAQLKGTIFIFANVGTSDFVHVLHLPSHSMGKPGTPTNYFSLIHEFFAKKSLAEILIGALIAPLLVITYVALTLGLFVAWRRFDRRFLAFCLVMTLYFVIVPGALGVVRFKLPALPFYIGFVGIGIAHVAQKWKARRGISAGTC